jgi:hypothetical protein
MIVAHDGGMSEAGDSWVDVTRAAWQFDDVRITAGKPMIGPARLRSPEGRTGLSRKPYLIVRVHIRNSGMSRDFAVPTWPLRGEHAIRLTDVTGRELLPAALEPGWVTLPPERLRLDPTQTANLIFLFEVPAAIPDGLRLELPGQQLGIGETIRLLLPRPEQTGARFK